MDNGFEEGMKVEIEHETNKYWVASIVGVFGHLLSLKWEGSSGQIFLDLRNKKCYPIGHFRKLSEAKIEPPPKINLSDKTILDVTIKYFQFVEETQRPLTLYTRGGTSTSLFDVKTVLEVAHKSDPEKHWFAEVKQNIGGRLQLRWLVKNPTAIELDDKKTPLDDFWLFFCHPRVHSLGAAKEKGNISYEPPVPYDSWISDIMIYIDAAKTDDFASLRKYFLSSAKRRKPELLDMKSLKAVEVGDQVLLFPSNLLKLLPATVEATLTETSFKIQANNADISFCYPIEDNHAILPFSWSDENEIPIDFGPDFTGDWTSYLKSSGSKFAPIISKSSDRIFDFRINGTLEVVHPDKPDMICDAIIIRVTPPLVWLQLSTESIYVIPFDSTDLLPSGFCQTHQYQLTKSLPSANSVNPVQSKVVPVDACGDIVKVVLKQEEETVEKALALSLPPATSSKAWCPRIYFNHKCFTGPSLSKSKICELPRFVGPGPVLLVMQEVISKIISVAYVPSRILNELSAKGFASLLKKEKIKKTDLVPFKAKYQKRTYRDTIHVIRSSEQVEEFCRCVCSHLKCCYNLFGPNLYDGDTCPSNCRGLTKSNKVLKRATYYREKAVEEKKLATATAIALEEASTPTSPRKMTLLATSDNQSNTIVQGDKSSKNSDEEVSEASSSSEEEAPKRRKVNRHILTTTLQDELEIREFETQKRLALVNSDSNSQEASVKENKRDRRVEPKKEVHERKAVVRPQLVKEPFDNPLKWSVVDVYKFIQKSNCSQFAGILREHVSVGLINHVHSC